MATEPRKEDRGPDDREDDVYTPAITTRRAVGDADSVFVESPVTEKAARLEGRLGCHDKDDRREDDDVEEQAQLNPLRHCHDVGRIGAA
jgi:hypothetical protein